MPSPRIHSSGLALLAATASVHAQLAYYGFDGQTFTPNSADAAVAVGDLSAGSGLGALTFAEGNPASGKALSATAWTSGAFNLAGNDYLEFALAPKSGFTMTLSGFEVDTRRSGTGPANWQLRSSLDSFTAALGTASPGTGVWTANQNIPLNGAFAELTGAVTFRLYGYVATGTSGTLRVDNVEVFGSAAAVPETHAFGLLAGLGLLGFAWSRRMRPGV